MEGTKIRPLDISDEFYLSLKNTFNYGVELFGILQALKYENLIYEEIELLPSRYLIHPECRYLPTKRCTELSCSLPILFYTALLTNGSKY